MTINSSRLLKYVFTSLVALVLIACGDKALKFSNVDITGSKAFGTDFSLIDHHGQKKSLADFRGKVVVMFFGYTQCPDVCPTTMSEMQAVIELMGKKGQQVQVLFVTVDPQRDTQELLAQYVPAFNSTFLGLRPASKDDLEKVTKDFKVFYNIVPGKTPNNYTIDHTAGSYVFDPSGRLRLFLNHQQNPKLIADDLLQLLK
jgi:protein SCO1/2